MKKIYLTFLTILFCVILIEVKAQITKNDFANHGPALMGNRISRTVMFEDRTSVKHLIITYSRNKRYSDDYQLAHINLNTGEKYLIEGTKGETFRVVYHASTHKVFIVSGDPSAFLEYDLENHTSTLITPDNTDYSGHISKYSGSASNLPDNNTQSIVIGEDDKIHLGGGIRGYALTYDPDPDPTINTEKPTMKGYGTVDDPMDSLLFTEYIHDESNQSCFLEITNSSGNRTNLFQGEDLHTKTYNLKDYEIWIYSDGSTSPTTKITLSNDDKVIAPQESFVIGNINDASVDLVDPLLSFDGNDAVVLYDKIEGEFVDIIGDIGCDPSSGYWEGGNQKTKNQRLYRYTFPFGGVTKNKSDGCDPVTTSKLLETEWRSDVPNTSDLGTTDLNYYRYVYSIGADEEYVYCGMRNQALWYLVSIHQTTGEQKIYWKFDLNNHVNVYKGVDDDGKIYWMASRNYVNEFGGSESEFYQLSDGAPAIVTQSFFNSLDYYSGNNEVLHNPSDFHNLGYEIDLADVAPINGTSTIKYKKTTDSDWTTATISGISNDPVKIQQMEMKPSGGILGISEAYLPVFEYDPVAKQGNILGQLSQSSVYDILFYNDNLTYFSGYSNSFIEYDSDKPWTLNPTTDFYSEETNPYNIKAINGAKYNYYMAKGSNGWVYVSGNKERSGRSGADFGWYNPLDQTKVSLDETRGSGFSNYNISDLITINNGNTLVAATASLNTSPPKLFLFDISNTSDLNVAPLQELELNLPSSSTGKIVEVESGVIVGLDKNFAYKLNLNDVSSLEILPFSGDAYGSFIKGSQKRLRQGPDGFFWFFVEEGTSTFLKRLNPVDMSLETVSEDLGNDKSRVPMFAGNEMYLYGGVHSINTFALNSSPEHNGAFVESIDITDYTPYILTAPAINCNTKKFFAEINANLVVTPGIIGLDFRIAYDPAVIEPTGDYSLGDVVTHNSPIATAYINASTEGELYGSIYYENTSPNTFFEGEGNIINVEFATKEGIDNSRTMINLKNVEEAYTLYSKHKPALGDELIVTSSEALMNAQVIYWDNESKPLAYDDLNNIGLVTYIKPTDNFCVDAGSALEVDDNGSFAIQTDNHDNFKISRDIDGSFLNPTCLDMLEVINGMDCYYAALISTFSTNDPLSGNSWSPNAFQMIAADVNMDDKVRANDISLMQKRIVGEICEFPQSWNYTTDAEGNVYPLTPAVPSLDWRFFDDATLTTSQFNIDVNYPTFTKSNSNGGYWRDDVPDVPSCFELQPNCGGIKNYYSVLLGDLDGNWTNNTKREKTFGVDSERALLFDFNKATLIGENKYRVPLEIENSDETVALDFSLNFDETLMKVINVVSNNSSMKYAWNLKNKNQLMFTSYSLDEFVEKGIIYIDIQTSDLQSASKELNNMVVYLNGMESKVVVDDLGELFGNENINLHPNPAKEKLNITFNKAPDSEFVISLYDISGAKMDIVLVKETSNRYAINTRDLKSGLYFLKVSDVNGLVRNLKFVKE